MKQTVVFLLAALAGFVVGIASHALYVQFPSLAKTEPAAVVLATSTPVAEIPESATILAFGDMMLDRAVRGRIETATSGPMYPFLYMQDFLHGNDIVVANAEGPFTHFPSKSLGNSEMVFTFDLGDLPTLKQLGFTVLSQANNHAFNFGAIGLRESQAAIQANGMQTFGDPSNENPGPLYQTVNGMQIAFVGYHQFSGTSTNVFEAIRTAKAAGAFVIVYPHWGVEYSPTQSAFQEAKGHMFVDAGADVVLGAHPHVIEPVEIYKGKALFYSMGNFIFDQGNSGPVSEGLSVRIVLTAKDVSYSIFPLSIKNAQASLMNGKDRTRILETLSKGALLPPEYTDIRSNILLGSFTLPR